MRSRDPLTSLADVQSAASLIGEFLRGKSFDDYRADRLLSSAVERQFEILGEALRRAVEADPSLVRRLPETSSAIGFRNILAHGYDRVSDALVWSIAHDRLPLLHSAVTSVLQEGE